MTSDEPTHDGLSNWEFPVALESTRSLVPTYAPLDRDTTQLPVESSLATLVESKAKRSPIAIQRLDRGATIGRFMVLRKLGEGGMGVVYSAYDAELDRRVAIKLLHPERHGSAALVRLQREAQGLAKVSHPHVVQVHEIGRHHGTVFIAMEYVAGQTLGEWRTSTPERSWREILEVVLQTGRGLAAAHAAKLIHRDFKPANVMVGDDGRARVLDFGLVRSIETEAVSALLDRDDLESSDTLDELRMNAAPEPLLTGVGTVLGTLAYMPYEQIQGERVDARSDQFAFCVVLFEALYGVRPFAGRTLGALVESVRNGEIRQRPVDTDVPRRIHEALIRGLARDPEDRWPDMASLLAELEAGLERSRATWAWVAIGALTGSLLLGGLATPWIQATLEAKNAEISESKRANETLVAQRELDQRTRERERELELDIRSAVVAAAMADQPGMRRESLTHALEAYVHSASRGAVPPEVEAGLFAVTRGLHRSWQLGEQVGPTSDFAYSPSGRLFAMSAGPTVELWSTTGAESQGTLRDHAGEVRSLEFTREGTRLLTTSEDGTAILWHVDTREQLDTIDEYDVAVARLSPSGTKLAVATAEGALAIYRIDPEGQLQREQLLTEQGPRIFGLQFGPDDARLLVVSDEVRLWTLDASEPGESRSLPDLSRNPANLGFSPDGSRIAGVDATGALRLFDGEGELVTEVRVEARTRFEALAFDPSGQHLATVSRGGAPKIWRAEDGALLVEVEGHPRGATDVTFSPDGNRLATVGFDGMVRVCDTKRGRLIETLEGEIDTVDSLAWSPKGDQIATADTRGHSGVMRLWSTALAAEQTQTFEVDGELTHLALSPDRARMLVVGEADGRAHIWNSATRSKRELADGQVVSAIFSLDGHRIATRGRDDQTRIWDAETGVALATFDPRDDTKIVSLAFSAKGDRLVTGNLRGEVRRWSRATPRRPENTWRISEDRVGISAVAVSPDDRWIAAGDLGGAVVVWGESGTKAHRFETSAAVNALVISRDGERLAAVGEDREVWVWELSQGTLLAKFSSTEISLHHADFSPDGKRLATGGKTSAQLWDIAAQRVLANFTPSSSELLDLRVSGDGRRVYAAHADGVVTHAVTAHQRLRLACEALRDQPIDASIAELCKDP